VESRDKAWLENRVRAAVEDDFYLDRDEEKRLKEEAAARGIPIRDAGLVANVELQRIGAVSERQLLDELDRLLHQFTDGDKLLDRKEERDAFDQVVIAAPGKKKGLDPRVAEDYVSSFCKVNGVRRSSGGRNWTVPALAAAIIALLLVTAIILFSRGSAADPRRGGGVEVTQEDRTEIDQRLTRASTYVERAQYTDPPERSAKAELDAIAQLDPGGSYRGEEANALRHRIVQHYLTLAERTRREGNREGARQWIERAKLMNVDREEISRKEEELGLTGA